MFKIYLNIDGMNCGACESNVNDVVRKTADVKSVNSSRLKKQTVIVCEHEIDEEAVKRAIAAQGYRVNSSANAPCDKKGLLSFFKK